MAEDETLYHNDYIEKAKKLQSIESLEERVKSALELSKQYHNSEMVQSGLRDDFITGFDFEKLGSLQKKIHNAHKDKKKSLTDNEADELIKDTLMEILPKVKYGTSDRETNFQAFEGYMTMLQKYTGGRTDFLEELKKAVKKGDGITAVNQIINNMIQFKQIKANQHFDSYVMPSDHLDLRQEFAKYITKETNTYLKGAGTIHAAEVSKRLDYALSLYSKGDHNKMLEEYGTTDQSKDAVKKTP
jgi:hypothetical protein